jgi:glycosyltransferase involved in cell wall biosynthesis
VSVVIPTFNYGRFVCHAVDSVLRQTVAPHEVIVVDDGSTDDTARALRSYGDAINLIRQVNRGVAAARNHGAREASGEVLAFLDADDEWHDTKLERQLSRLCADPDLGLVHCGVEEIDGVGHILRDRSCDGLEGWVASDLLLLERPVILCAPSGVILTRDLFWQLEGFDERLSTSADWDFCVRAALKRRVAFVPEPLVRYRLHDRNMHHAIAAMEHDMILAFSRAFGRDDRTQLLPLRRRAYANLHMMLAGSYWSNGEPTRAIRHVWKSLYRRPAGAARLAGYPARLTRRHLAGKGA